MKGTEGIDYVITKCGHCDGKGKCDCYDCIYLVAKTYILDIDKDLGEYLKYTIAERQKEGAIVGCKVCHGVGQVVFWREDKIE